MKNIQHLIALIIIFNISSCGTPPPYPYLTNEELVQESEKAELGDGRALKRIATHYYFTHEHNWPPEKKERAEQWLKMAAETGDPENIWMYSTIIAEDPSRCEEAVSWRTKVIHPSRNFRDHWDYYLAKCFEDRARAAKQEL